jgi:hypothetical protein
MIINTEDCMANTQALIAEVYSAFNQRNIDGPLHSARSLASEITSGRAERAG